MNVAELVSNLREASAAAASSRPGGVSSAAPRDGWQQTLAAAQSQLQHLDKPGILPTQTDTPSALDASATKGPDSTKGAVLDAAIVADLRGNEIVAAAVVSEPNALIRETGIGSKELGSKLRQQRCEGAVDAPCFKPAPKSKTASGDSQDVPGILSVQQVVLSLPGQLTASVAATATPHASSCGFGKLNPPSATALGAQGQMNEQQEKQAAPQVKDEADAISDAPAAPMPKTATASWTQPPLSSVVQQPEQNARTAENSTKLRAQELVGPGKPEPIATAEQGLLVTFNAHSGVSAAGKERSTKSLRADSRAPSAPEYTASRAVDPGPNFVNNIRITGTLSNAPAESPNHSYAEVAPPLTAGDAFAALDRTAPAPRLTWQHAGAQQAEAGFNDPALGWISVRAQLHGGSVEASLIPSSLSAAAELGAHVSPLNAHLAANNFASASVSLSSPEQFSGAGNNQHGNQNQQREQSAQDVPSHSVPAPRNAIPNTPAPLPAHNRNSSLISVVA